MPHDDIRIGTIADLKKGAAYLKQVLPHGFEVFELTNWMKVEVDDLDKAAKEALETISGKAIIGSLGCFGNPLQDERTRTDFIRMVEAAPKFGCNLVTGFSGCLEGKPVPEAMPRMKEVWTPILKLAKDRGVRIAFENCDMGGTWHAAKFNIAHSPAAWELIFDAFSEFDNLGLEWEPCHQMVSLVDPLPQLRELVAAKRIFAVHGKDATVDTATLKKYGLRSGKPFVWHRTPGFGDTNWTDLISILRMAKWTGNIVIEGWHDPVYKGDLEMTGQVHALNYLKNCRGGAYVPNPV